ncbi:hypothetical protein KOW79_001699 [Hemibagrus wyckioides]|uniref:Protein FAM104A-like n=1 Tax=Hemibagrus wyckioides TaxID=337641 RepID=A0A9D3SXX6_9TELE|nr:uncharacterized protein LOC131344515 [Hemibagrus wyckioides]KAG7335103.1 hypothetical protein KOW79_001699 [Hemibagrus wyckioides]
MLTENRKRQRTQGDDDALLMPQAKRTSTTAQFSEGSREAWESESSSSDSSGVSSPEHAAGTSSSASSQYGAENLRSCSPHSSLDQSDATTLASYERINRVLREAHFQSLHNRGQSRDR